MSIRSSGRTLAVFSVRIRFIAVPSRAQETVHSASVSGRVVDPQGAVVPGCAGRRAPDRYQLTRDTVTDADGRFRFPYLKVGPLRDHGPAGRIRGRHARADADRRAPRSSCRSRSRSAALDASVTVTAEATVLEAARSQIAGTVSQAEVQNLPMNGRNFLDLALLVPGVSPTNVAQHAALSPRRRRCRATASRSAASATSRTTSSWTACRPTTMPPALSGIPYGVDAVEQFQVVTSGGQAELGRALGGYINVVTKSGTNASRGDVYGYFRDDGFNARERAVEGAKLPMNQKQYRRQPRRSDRARPDVLLHERRAARARPDRARRRSRRRPSAAINARLAAVGYPGSPVDDRHLSQPGAHARISSARSITRSAARDQFSVRYSLYDVDVEQRARRRRAERALRVGGARQHRSDGRRSATR